jgi:hypothetical protein
MIDRLPELICSLEHIGPVSLNWGQVSGDQPNTL